MSLSPEEMKKITGEVLDITYKLRDISIVDSLMKFLIFRIEELTGKEIDDSISGTIMTLKKHVQTKLLMEKLDILREHYLNREESNDIEQIYSNLWAIANINISNRIN